MKAAFRQAASEGRAIPLADGTPGGGAAFYFTLGRDEESVPSLQGKWIETDAEQ